MVGSSIWIFSFVENFVRISIWIFSFMENFALFAFWLVIIVCVVCVVCIIVIPRIRPVILYRGSLTSGSEGQ